MSILYIAANGAMPTTAALTPITTGTAIKTMLQIATPATCPVRVIEWGISFDGNVAGTPIRCELVDTGAVAATVTAHVAAGVQPYDNPLAPSSLMTLGTTATGYTATVEGSTTVSRYADVQLVSPRGSRYIKQWALGREFTVNVSRVLRVRVTAPVAVLCYTYIIWDE